MRENTRVFLLRGTGPGRFFFFAASLRRSRGERWGRGASPPGREIPRRYRTYKYLRRAVPSGKKRRAWRPGLAEFSEACGMSLAHRIIPCLDTDGERVVKGVNFVGLRDAGDPVALAARYNTE